MTSLMTSLRWDPHLWSSAWRLQPTQDVHMRSHKSNKKSHASCGSQSACIYFCFIYTLFFYKKLKQLSSTESFLRFSDFEDWQFLRSFLNIHIGNMVTGFNLYDVQNSFTVSISMHMGFQLVCLLQKCFAADKTREVEEYFSLSEVKSFLRKKFPVLGFLKFLAIRESGFLIKSFL